MFEKLKQQITTPSKQREEVIGLVLLLIFILTSFTAGVSFGRSPTDKTEIARTDARLSRIEAAIHSTACEAAVIDAVRDPVEHP